MTWTTAVTTTAYYFILPLTTLFGWLLIALAPLLHLVGYLISTSLLPLRLLAKFETLYIYLGVAAVIGLITGSVLHLSSSLILSLFNLSPGPEIIPIRSAASVRAAREEKKLEDAWRSSSSRGGDSSLEKRYAEWLEKDAGKRREEGLAGQTILEEEDDSEF